MKSKRTSVQTKRLQKWAESLKALRPTKTKTFNMAVFHEDLYKENGKIVDVCHFNENDKPISEPCGFAACAVGWLPTFFPRNFKVMDVNNSDIEERVEDFFGLDRNEFSEIVYPDHYTNCRFDGENLTPKDVVKKIKEVLKGEHSEDQTCDACGCDCRERD